MLKREIAGFEMILLVLASVAFSFIMGPEVCAQTASAPSYCCEKTTYGAKCVNDDEDKCDSSGSFKSVPTSCETTSYCKEGTCYDSEEGLCMENTPLSVCDASGGTWDEREPSEIPVCQLGCCIIADQAAFVPLVRCKYLASKYGVNVDYRTNIDSEAECVATAQSQDVGACVSKQEYSTTCEFTTRGECRAEDGIVNNKNARILRDKDGKAVLEYVFADETSVIITDKDKTAEEIMLRLASGQIKK